MRYLVQWAEPGANLGDFAYARSGLTGPEKETAVAILQSLGVSFSVHVDEEPETRYRQTEGSIVLISFETAESDIVAYVQDLDAFSLAELYAQCFGCSAEVDDNGDAIEVNR
jgi:hypothetical protein